MLLAALLVALGACLTALVNWAQQRALERTLFPSQHARVLLVTAHPDDEAMFFAPTVLRLRALHIPVFVLCLSTGNADGKGAVRVRELYRACEKLQVPEQNVDVVDDQQMQDGMGELWPEHVVQKYVHAHVKRHNINTVITFDGKGVSGHPNHIATYHGVRAYAHWRSASSSNQGGSEAIGLSDLSTFSLESTNLLRKYIGCLDVLVSLLSGQRWLVLNLRPWMGVAAMLQHCSQLVWYRWLFITLSRYSYVNTLRLLEC